MISSNFAGMCTTSRRRYSHQQRPHIMISPKSIGSSWPAAERQQRSRFMRGFFAGLERKWPRRELRRPGEWGNWVATGPADMIGHQIASACFNWGPMTPNYSRWVEIATHVRERLIQLEIEFSEFRDNN
jgi:hypothetical protein